MKHKIPSKSARVTPLYAALFIFLVSIAIYANTIGHDFVWDDRDLIVNNPSVRTFDGPTVLKTFTEDFWQAVGPDGGYYRPVIALSYQIDYAIGGGTPLPFHLTNVLLNAIAAVLVFALTYLLFGDVVVGLVTSVIFAVHPIHTEAVAWISGRTDIFATVWMLASLYFYVLSRRRQRLMYLVISLVTFMLAMLSKETALCMPLLILLLESRPFEPLFVTTGSAGARARAVRNTLLFLGVLALYLTIRSNVIGEVGSSYPGFASGTLRYVALPLSILGGYVYKVLMPVKLSAEYDAPIPESFGDPAVLMGGFTLLVIAFAVWRLRNRLDVVLGTAIFLFGLAPAMNVIPIAEVSAERFLYFPSFGFAIIAGHLFGAVLQTKFPAIRRSDSVQVPAAAAGHLVVLLAVILLAFAGMTITRNPDWRNEYVLFTKTALQEPDNPRALASAGKAAEQRGDYATAVRAYRRSIEIDHNNVVALNNLTVIYTQQRQLRAALPLAERAARLSPEDAQAVNNLGVVYLEMNQYDKAATQFERSMELDPNYTRALNNLAVLYAQQDRFAEAIPLIERAIRLSPRDADLHSNLGFVYSETKQFDKAAKEFEKALELSPQMPNAHFRLALILYQQGNPVSARVHFQQVVGAGPDFHLANFYLAVIEDAAGRTESAKQWARSFLAAYPQEDEFRREAEAIARVER